MSEQRIIIVTPNPNSYEYKYADKLYRRMEISGYAVSLYTEDDYKKNKLSIIDNDIFIFWGKARNLDDARTKNVWIEFDKFGMKYGWTGNICIVYASKDDLSWKEWDSFVDYCQDMRRKYKGIEIPERNHAKEVLNEAMGKNNAGSRCQYSALILEFFDCGGLRKFITAANKNPVPLEKGTPFTFNARKKEQALIIYKAESEKYTRLWHKVQGLGNRLHNKRCDSVLLIHDVEHLVNSIANRPKEFDKKISDIQVSSREFQETEKYAEQSLNDAIKAGKAGAIGVIGGAAVANIAPQAAMWVATTFGRASTGAAIATLHGAAATNAALAWLGGGAVAAGGAGVAGGQLVLALAGPIGWGISGLAIISSLVEMGFKNGQIADEAIAETEKIKEASAELNEASAKIENILGETEKLLDALQESVVANQRLEGSNYLDLSEEKQYQLGAIVNNTLSLSEMLNKTI